MFEKPLTVARKYAAKAVTAAGALALSTAVMAQEEAGAGSTILAKVKESLSTGSDIATAVVLGLFVIFGIKLLWRSK